MDRLFISDDDMVIETQEFAKVYPILIHEIDHIERARGKLNDFQLMLAVSRAKDSLGVLGWERRQTVNSILEKYAQIYREYGREAADEWVHITFGFMIESSYDEAPEMPAQLSERPNPETDVPASEETGEASGDVSSRLYEISHLIAVKESELLQLYREYYRLSQRS